MTTEAINRLRRANPVTAETHVDERLFATIVSSAGDSRLGSAKQRSRRRRRVQVAIAILALTIGVGAAWAAVAGPLELFRENPQGRDASPSSLWDQDVVPSSIVRAAVLPIPGYGNVEYWYADARQGGWCGAIRLPSGTWAATKESGIGGTAPGCYPTREQTNAVEPVFVINGFDYYDDQVDLRDRGGAFWRIYYGILSTNVPVAAVIDRVTGRRAKVHGGKTFAIAIPDGHPERAAPTVGYALDLVAYDAARHIVAEEHPEDP